MGVSAGRASSLRYLRVEQLRANSWNPNTMSEKEFSEYRAEVAHIGRLPKPILARPLEDGSFEVIDGAHALRIAEELGYTEVPCEVEELTEVEAMRATYKRNRGGRDDKVLLGRMFERIAERGGPSNRKLA
jgi:ParB-like chromosome segregation protein Spo0J